MLYDDKMIGSRVIQLYEGRLKEWAEELLSQPGLVLAISRKGPRLIELLIREGLLPRTFMRRVISEYALPFIRKCRGNLIVADDAINYGSTFSKTISLAQEVSARCDTPVKVIGLPFAVSDEASPEYLTLVSKYFLRLRSGEPASFVNNLALAFRLLGKSFDIDHPMLTFAGDFRDEYRVASVLEEIAWRLGGKLIPLETQVPTAKGFVNTTAWTILLDPCPTKAAGSPGICKLRLYLYGGSEMRVAAMSPFTVNRTDLSYLKKILSPNLNELWQELTSSVESCSPSLQRAANRSLATWASFLASTLLLHSSKDKFIQELASHDFDVSWFGPRQDDLRLLIGPDFCKLAEDEIDNFLKSTPVSEDEQEVAQPSISELELERIPSEYAEQYSNRLTSLLGHSTDIDDAIKSVFYAQHIGIEKPSRKHQTNGNDRLEFGLNYGKLRSILKSSIGVTDETLLHRCLDRLIDDGCVVPVLLNIGDEKVQEWVHVFRVGEGSIPIMAHTVRLLFEELTRDSPTKELSRITFEKFCALALSVASDNKDLIPLHRPELFKRFHLYGARMVVNTGQKENFLLDWAVDHSVLTRSVAADVSEAVGNYRLSADIDDLYPKNECPFDDDVKDAVEDLALLVRTITKASYLIALTTVATNHELHQALEAELDLWLHDKNFSVYEGLKRLFELSRKWKRSRKSKTTLKESDFSSSLYTLRGMANFTAQADYKKKLAERRESIYSEIDAKAAAADRVVSRSWRKLRSTLDSRLKSEEVTSGYTEILSALSIAHGCNRLLRDLLAFAGYEDPKDRSQPVGKSIELLRLTLTDRTQVDQATRTMFAAKDGRPDVDQMLAIAASDLPDTFSDAVEKLRPVVLEIASRCEEVLRHYSSEERQEAKQALEPPKYIVMWDIRGSTAVESREPLEKLIGQANARIAATLGSRARDFNPDDKNDGNGLICENFFDVLTVFQILNEVFASHPFRAGCEVNLQGRLDYYPKSKALGGRAFEFAARVAAMFKELDAHADYWSGGDLPKEPSSSYLVVGEFARRYAEKEGAWPVDGYDIQAPDGQYHARVKTGLPISVTILSPNMP